MTVSRNLSFLLTAIVGLTPLAHANDAEYVDKPGSSVRHEMHACERGFMTGVNAGPNELLCKPFPGAGADEIVDSSSQSHSMHACPDGMAMTGWDSKRNLLLCRGLSGYTGRSVEQAGAERTIREKMHACPEGQVMVGYEEGRNELLCAFKQ